MITNFLKTKCTVQAKTVISGALGDTVTWADAASYWCRRMSVDVQTRTAYQQLNTAVTDKFLLGGTVDLRLGAHRIVHEGKTYELVESGQHIEGNTSVLVREL